MTAQQEKMPVGQENQCTARTKKCRACEYRYKKGDKSWHCPNCEEPRRCTNKAVTSYTVCRLHGARGGKPPNIKTAIPERFEAAFNHIAQHPHLWDLAEQQTALSLRFSELFESLDDVQATHLSVDFVAVMDRLNDMERALRTIPPGKTTDRPVQNAITALNDMRSEFMPAYREDKLWEKITNLGEYLRKNYDTTMRHLQADEQMIPVAMVVEVMSLIMKEALLFIIDPNDRKVFNDRLRQFFPRDTSKTNVIDAKIK